MRVLDTAALLHWPVSELAGNICSQSQQAELERVSPQRWMLIQAIDIDWRAPDSVWLAEAKRCAAQSGDLPRLSDVDLDILALALGLNIELVTDDYRLQNTMKSSGKQSTSVDTSGTKQVWTWIRRCTGCRHTTEVPADVARSKKGNVGECDRCGAALVLKKKR
ncbi:MAG: hypothetical protein L7U62_03455 [Candidatus Poseidoniaceae archaeon]|nr:hypothetical protein [Candidatus Poseidoniaceae archaeon]